MAPERAKIKGSKSETVPDRRIRDDPEEAELKKSVL